MSDPESLADGTLLRRVDGGTVWLTLNRPDVGNALTPDQRNTLMDLLHEADLDSAVRAVVIASTGKHFCTGADLRAPQPQMEQTEPDVDPPPEPSCGCWPTGPATRRRRPGLPEARRGRRQRHRRRDRGAPGSGL